MTGLYALSNSDGKSDAWVRSAPYGVLATGSHGPRFCEIPSVYLLEGGLNSRIVQELMAHGLELVLTAWGYNTISQIAEIQLFT